MVKGASSGYSPVKFLSKWLYKESKAKELELKYKQEEEKKEKLRQICNLKKKKQEQIQKDFTQKNKEFEMEKEKLISKIEGCKDFEANYNEFCDDLKNIIKATGVYMAVHDRKRKPVTEDDDENGHIVQPEKIVVRYIGWCKDHQFLKGKCLDENKGVTYSLFGVQQNNPDPNAENQGEQAEQQQPTDGQINPEQNKKDENKNDKIKTVEVDDVLLDPRVVFFKEPRLGSYYALNIDYASSLSYKSLQNSIEKYTEYTKLKNDYDQRFAEWKVKNDEIISTGYVGAPRGRKNCCDL